MTEKVAKKLGEAQELIEDEKLDEGVAILNDILEFKRLSQSNYRLEKKEGKLMLAGLQGPPKEVFKMAKLTDVFERYPDVMSATEKQL